MQYAVDILSTQWDLLGVSINSSAPEPKSFKNVSLSLSLSIPAPPPPFFVVTLQPPEQQIVVGICCMMKKSKSKPMTQILERLCRFEYITVVIFPEDVILNEPVENWPLCDCLISFHSKGASSTRSRSKTHTVRHINENKPVLNDHRRQLCRVAAQSKTLWLPYLSRYVIVNHLII